MANGAHPGTLADPGVGSRARGLERQLLRGDGGGVQQTRHRPVQLLQQHLQEQQQMRVLTAAASSAARRHGPHLGGRHVLEGHVPVGQLTGRNPQAVNVRAGIVTLKVLRGENV